MAEKTYPQIVRLKKSIIGIVVICITLILVVILRNLYNASVTAAVNQSQSVTTVKTVATQSDTGWYQNEAINQPVQKPSAEAPTPAKQAAPTVGSEEPSSVNNSANPSTGMMQQDVLKAMSASIGSNQITDTRQIAVAETRPSPIATTMQDGPPQPMSDQNMQGEKKSFLESQAAGNDYLGGTLKDPLSPYEVQAGTLIPGILITGINSDLPGQIKAQVRSNVYDSISGKYVLIPQGSVLIGLYDSQVAYGQERVLVAWRRVIFPNGQSINLEGMPGADLSGYAGFNDQVNNHYAKIFGSVILMSILGAGAQLSQPQNTNDPWQAPSVGQTVAQSLGTNLANTANMLTAKNVNIQPTLEIRQGYLFNITVTKDIVFLHPYNG